MRTDGFSDTVRQSNKHFNHKHAESFSLLSSPSTTAISTTLPAASHLNIKESESAYTLDLQYNKVTNKVVL